MSLVAGATLLNGIGHLASRLSSDSFTVWVSGSSVQLQGSTSSHSVTFKGLPGSSLPVVRNWKIVEHGSLCRPPPTDCLRYFCR